MKRRIKLQDVLDIKIARAAFSFVAHSFVSCPSVGGSAEGSGSVSCLLQSRHPVSLDALDQ